MIKELYFDDKSPTVASMEDLAALEAKLGVRFPPAFVEFCTRWNGGFPSKANRFCPVPPEYTEFHVEYKKSGGIIADKLIGATNEFPQCSLLKEIYRLDKLSKFIMPIARDLFGNRVVLRIDSPTGTVYWSDQDLWEPTEDSPPHGPKFAGKPILFPIAPDLETFYNSLTTDPP